MATLFEALIRENESFFETFIWKSDGIPVDISDPNVEIYAQFRDSQDSAGVLVLDASTSSGHINKTANAGEFTIFITLAELKLSFMPEVDYYFETVVRTGISPNFHYKSLFLGRIRRSGELTVVP